MVGRGMRQQNIPQRPRPQTDDNARIVSTLVLLHCNQICHSTIAVVIQAATPFPRDRGNPTTKAATKAGNFAQEFECCSPCDKDPRKGTMHICCVYIAAPQCGLSELPSPSTIIVAVLCYLVFCHCSC